jgi:hypothetical protein
MYATHPGAFDLLAVSLCESRIRMKASLEEDARKPKRILYYLGAARAIRLFEELFEGPHWLIYVGIAVNYQWAFPFLEHSARSLAAI